MVEWKRFGIGSGLSWGSQPFTEYFPKVIAVQFKRHTKAGCNLWLVWSPNSPGRVSRQGHQAGSRQGLRIGTKQPTPPQQSSVVWLGNAGKRLCEACLRDFWAGLGGTGSLRQLWSSECPGKAVQRANDSGKCPTVNALEVLARKPGRGPTASCPTTLVWRPMMNGQQSLRTPNDVPGIGNVAMALVIQKNRQSDNSSTATLLARHPKLFLQMTSPNPFKFVSRK